MNVSLDRAWKTGKILAETIISGNLGVRPITLVGFSLGSRLIYSCLIEMARRGGYGLIENVIILGPQSLLTLIKCQRQDRWLVEDSSTGIQRKTGYWGIFFRATGGGIRAVAGLSPLDNVHGVENIDCTDLVEGIWLTERLFQK